MLKNGKIRKHEQAQGLRNKKLSSSHKYNPTVDRIVQDKYLVSIYFHYLHEKAALGQNQKNTNKSMGMGTRALKGAGNRQKEKKVHMTKAEKGQSSLTPFGVWDMEAKLQT